MRDILAEAKSWREHVRSEDLAALLVGLDETALVAAYNRWWSVYTTGIQKSPSSRRPEGVAGADAQRAGKDANAATIALIQADTCAHADFVTRPVGAQTVRQTCLDCGDTSDHYVGPLK